jgi:two-component system cell cycle response regulator
LETCRRERPDAALLDIEMPVLDGFEVLRELKGDADLADIPVVFLTARTGTDDLVVGLQLGAHDYLKKPFEPAELIARVSAAVRVKELQDQLRLRNAELDAISRVDPLTGLYNRRHLAEHLASSASASRRHRHPLSIVLFDLDHFKSVNDHHGHAAGDAVLREFAARLRSNLRVEDVAARWGGEEFLVLLPMTDRKGAAAFADRIRAALSAEPFDLGNGQTGTVTVSAGSATSGAEDVEVLVQQADEALYAAKAAGRDRSVSVGGP